MDHPKWGRLGFVGIYRPDEIEGRTDLWPSLFFSLDASYRWIMMGNYNMIEHIQEGSKGPGGLDSLLAGKERGASVDPTG